MVGDREIGGWVVGGGVMCECVVCARVLDMCMGCV